MLHVGLGIVGAGVLSKFMESLLYRVNPLDPISFVMASVFLVGIALLAAVIPARRATRIDPMIALRHDRRANANFRPRRTTRRLIATPSDQDDEVSRDEACRVTLSNRRRVQTSPLARRTLFQLQCARTLLLNTLSRRLLRRGHFSGTGQRARRFA